MRAAADSKTERAAGTATQPFSTAVTRTLQCVPNPMGSHIGTLKVAARRLRLDFADYKSRIECGLKHCTTCKRWQPIASFGKDLTRYDGRDAKCVKCRRVENPYASLKGRISTFKGKSHTPRARALMSAAKKGKPSPKQGIPRTQEEREAISRGIIKSPNTPRAEKHYAFSFGRRQRKLNDRRSHLYPKWREAVFQRDGYRCQKCGDDRGGNLRAHHLKSFAEHPELRFEISNGITLCHTCHELEHFKPESIRNVRKLKRGEKLWAPKEPAPP
ncbi:MAG TPA: HNH endonuclease [Methylomirabilota bacterium]|nr:HNH endonuclease [Methylomirabilota bacterium]